MDWTKLWDPIATPVGFVLSLIAARLWSRYLSRLAIFRWSAVHNTLAMSGTDPKVGEIEVLWNKTQVKHLQFCRIEFENESSRDFTDVELKFWYEDGTEFIGEGSLSGTAQFIPYAAHYAERVHQMITLPEDKRPPELMEYAFAHREYRVPVVNRAMRFGIMFVISSPSAQSPTLLAACDHKGVKLVHRTSRPMFYGVVQVHAALAGLAIGAVATAVVLALGASGSVLAASAFLLGAFCAFLGAVGIRLKRKVVSWIG